MSTINQKIITIRITKKKSTPSLNKCPHKKGSCVQILIKTPRKPSSGKRKVARVKLKKGNAVNCHIPGIGHSIQKFSTVLIRGCRVRDIPAMKYRIIRGKFDAKSVYERLTSRSKYGLKKKSEE